LLLGVVAWWRGGCGGCGGAPCGALGGCPVSVCVVVVVVVRSRYI